MFGGQLTASVGRLVRRVPTVGMVLIGPLPYLAALRHMPDKPPSATLVCVYRRQNLNNVLHLVGEAKRMAMHVRLWALDDPAPELARLTVGSGPGSRFQLLNRLAGDRGTVALAGDRRR